MSRHKPSPHWVARYNVALNHASRLPEMAAILSVSCPSVSSFLVKMLFGCISTYLNVGGFARTSLDGVVLRG
jgi:hypothetical protein